MKELKAAAAEEHLKEKEAKLIHDRRIRIAGERLDLQHAAYLKVKQRLKDKKNEEGQMFVLIRPFLQRQEVVSMSLSDPIGCEIQVAIRPVSR